MVGVGVVIAIIISCCISILLISLMVFSMRDNSYKSQKEAKETKKMKHVVPDAEYNKLIEQYGRVAVYNAELEYNWFLLNLNDRKSISLSFADMCELQNKKLKERESKIKYIKRLSKEELELYLLQEEAIKQIKLKKLFTNS